MLTLTLMLASPTVTSISSALALPPMRFPGMVTTSPAAYPVPAFARLMLTLASPTVKAISSAPALPPIRLPRILMLSPRLYPLPASV